MFANVQARLNHLPIHCFEHSDRPMVSKANRGRSEELAAADATDLHRTVRHEGEAELNRPAAALLWSGLAAGIAINASLLFEGVLYSHLPNATWSPLVIALGYPIRAKRHTVALSRTIPI